MIFYIFAWFASSTMDTLSSIFQRKFSTRFFAKQIFHFIQSSKKRVESNYESGLKMLVWNCQLSKLQLQKKRNLRCILEVGDMNDRGSARRRYTLWQAGWSPGQSQTQVILLLTLILKLLFCCSMVTWSEFWSNTESSKGTKGRARLPNRMNFWKKSKLPLTPPPSFLVNYIANLL